MDGLIDTNMQLHNVGLWQLALRRKKRLDKLIRPHHKKCDGESGHGLGRRHEPCASAQPLTKLCVVVIIGAFGVRIRSIIDRRQAAIIQTKLADAVVP